MILMILSMILMIPLMPSVPPADPSPINNPAGPATAADADEEPQNALTQKFTEEEWAALKEFRILLPDILEKAYEGKEGAPNTPIVIWGVTLDPNGKKDARASVVLMKWLRARNLSVEGAKTMMIDTLRWREEFNIEAAMNETFPDILEGFSHLYGRDKDGRPICYDTFGAGNDPETALSDVQRFVRWRVALMEQGIKLLDFENVDQMVEVYDYEGIPSLSNQKAALSTVCRLLLKHYPEFVDYRFFVNAPASVRWMLWLFKPIASVARIRIKPAGCGPRTIGKELLPFIDVKQLPEQYGGVVKDAW